MSWRRFRSRIRSIVHPNATLGSDLKEEISGHIVIETEENIERGMDPVEARRAAILKFGNPEIAQEESEAMWSFPSLSSIAADIRFGWRVLWKSPAFAVVALSTLALGISASTAIFNVVYAILFKPLPYLHPEQLVLLHQYSTYKDSGNWSTTALDYLDWRERFKSFSSLAAYTGTGLTFTGNAQPEMVLGQLVSANLFSTLGVTPFLGRTFISDEERKGQDRTVILRYDLWQRRFAGDRDVIGRVVTINGQSYSVIGVMPKGFEFPSHEYQAWVPFAFYGSVDTNVANRSAHLLRCIGRLRDGVSMAQASVEGKRIASDLERQYPDTDIGEGLRMEPLNESVIGHVRPSLLLLLAASAGVMLIACANVANLLLARGTGRIRELAVRQALGASTLRIFRQFMIENLVLCALGGSIGVALAYVFVMIVIRLGPEDLPRLHEISVNGTVLLFACVISIGTGLLFGILPLFSARGLRASEALKSTARAMSASRLLNRFRLALVTAEIAISGILVITTGLALRSLDRLYAVDPGFDPQHAVSFSFDLVESSYPKAWQMRTFTHELLDGLQGRGALKAVALATTLPLQGGWINPVSTDHSTTTTGNSESVVGESALASIRPVAGDYFGAMGMPLRIGRSIGDRDTQASEHVVVINETAARKLFAGDPTGQHLKLGSSGSNDPWRTVVGVVGDIKERGLDSGPDPDIYIPYDQLGDKATEMAGRGLYLIMRTETDLAAAVNFARAQVWQRDPNLAIRNIEPLTEIVGASVAQPKFRSLLFSIFAAISLLLAGIGLYGVLSYAVAQRTQEFGIRIALGATPADLRRLVLRLGGPVLLVGLTTALVAGFVAERLLRSVVFGIAPRDPVTFLSMTGLVTGITILAMFIPARRAMRVDPVVALKYE
jgi:putative ABC transport system permease protein